MMKFRLAIGTLALVATPAMAQTPQGAAAGQSYTAVNSVQQMFNVVRGHLAKVAEQAPDSVYAFRPVEGVRTFGQLLAHIADAHHMVCTTAMGSPERGPGIERSATTKAQIVEALRASYAPCEQAFAQADADVLQPLTLFGMQMSRLGALTLVATHDWEHYGNLVTYMRMNGMVPPSSQ